jgi:hypothetical protein
VTETVGALVSRASQALESLGLLGEDVEDEWTFVTDLVDAQQARFSDIADRRGPAEMSGERAGAIDAAIEEIGRIVDPHRAIDWLSTFPDLVALALDEPIGGGTSATGG